MFDITFDLYSHGSDTDAQNARLDATYILEKFNIPYTLSFEEIFFPEPPGKKQRTFYVVYKICLQNEEDYNTYMIIKD